MLERANTSQAVADVVIQRIVSGELAAGDRVDLDALGKSLGVSRSPIREALIQLERDGLVEMPYHRGAFIAEVGVADVREGFTLYALLSALPVRGVVSRRDPEVWAELTESVEAALAAGSVDEFEKQAQRFRRSIARAGGGPHLRSLLRTFNGLVRVASRLAMEDDLEQERTLLRAEYDAIRDDTPAAAVAATVRHVVSTGEHAVRVLRDRGVLPDSEGDALDVTVEDLLTVGNLVRPEGEA
ncbi:MULTISPECIES: GntR family transcriptional regulator [unclassified Nocardioides]|uniref:GntR family transcriptional regulator n=1 Tax=unclassified Nocardioides TaxID=2615069 RepID=UPI00114F7052|nr:MULTISPECIES: GntR family transcriptional regulator [unclassified Nocardioides]TQK72291.1 GntR family transcriptional regulator [Nocardioides sp. SLBN-35]WGY03497.1 GntR family transcriptional regulator [Nocardioides sp. QY071]